MWAPAQEQFLPLHGREHYHIAVIGLGPALWAEGHQDPAAKARPLLEKH